MDKPEPLQTIALSAKALKNIEKRAWPNGANLGCRKCQRFANKTPEQMARYMKKWPRCPECGELASVRPL
jgi:hypothetical protein